MIELTNRLRINPAAELPLLLNSPDIDTQNALTFFHVDQQALAAQWSQLSPAPPVAWSYPLTVSAYLHNLRMLKYDRQSHQLPGETELTVRTGTDGYKNASFVGENVYAYMQSVAHGHAGFTIDWGDGPNGIQDPPGHRDNLMAPVYREVGISIIDTLPGKTVGASLVTQDFGARRDQINPYLLGVVYSDLNRDHAYTPGEGAVNVTVIASGSKGTFTTSTMSAGGYQLALPPGVYTLRASGGGFKGIASLGGLTISSDNLKHDFTAPEFTTDTVRPTARLSTGNITEGGAAAHYFTITYSDNAAINASTISDADLLITAPDKRKLPVQLYSLNQPENGTVRTATYRMFAPGGFFDAADNGTYTIILQPSQVADTNGNFIATAALGSFTVSSPNVFLTPAGLMNATGTAGSDSIVLALTSSRTRTYLQVRLNGRLFSYPYRSVARLSVQGLAGNDTITLGRSLIGVTVDAGAGNDTVLGTDSSDYFIGGDGDDLFYGFLGKDYISGGLGYDRAQRDSADTFNGVERLLDS